VQHYVKLRAGLGPNTVSTLDDYLAREFVSHLSMNYLQFPKPGTASVANPPAFPVGLH